MSAKDQYPCVLCNAKFKSKDLLQEHFRKHGKELDMRGKPIASGYFKNTKCDICGTSFVTTSAAIRHRFKKHPNAHTKFYCHYCGKHFPLEIHRDHHQLSHDKSESERKEQHRKCEECNVLFYNAKALRYHYRCHKSMEHLLQPIITPPPSNKVKINSMNDVLSVYYCHLCGVEYLSKFNLQRHLKDRHMQDREMIMSVDVIKCTVCTAVFCSKKAFNAHNKFHQPNAVAISEQQRHNVTKINLDCDRRIETVADKYISRSNASKRQLSKKRIVELKEIKQEIKEEVKQEIKEELISSSDDELVYINDSVNPVTSRKICH
ncbi:PREDICTED: zinc finger and SCAN domain-containing protein 10-like [Dinoponera quadriceps]|uniref:Zinc finger and SCAN domain-containing protein 10-like n=1 Tax=Dinoponera quadriceps TaxID=609295 RepID=A0A6P3Y5C9_DINQU|nr:PREDICTED: zinc finger and SCAN domain-containing protein 10-like [Dinoponera quadriceps]XP_014485533.1 PREDICTED: zinc finger and SCAN domain-containing protein 10-like [Dinoponera quadriceps]